MGLFETIKYIGATYGAKCLPASVKIYLWDVYYDIIVKKINRPDKKGFNRTWLKSSANEPHFNFAGAKLPDLRSDKILNLALRFVFYDTFFIPCLCDDNHDKNIIRKMEQYQGEGPYGYMDGEFNVSVKEGDTVIDAGAWIGDFAAYAASKSAVTYAFEPGPETFGILEKTAALNDGKIIPVNKGLGETECKMPLYSNQLGSGAFTTKSVMAPNQKEIAKIQITTVDRFVESRSIKRIDFIKSDIEGAERDMLRGAVKTLREFAPKLAICTYHFPEDPELLEKIILDANQNYKVVHIAKKLFASV
jgi:FkbM family methyltransferase